MSEVFVVLHSDGILGLWLNTMDDAMNGRPLYILDFVTAR